MGIGMSRLLTVKLEQCFPLLKIIGTVLASEVQKAVHQYHPYVMISTVDVSVQNVSYIVVSSFLTEEKHDNLKRFCWTKIWSLN